MERVRSSSTTSLKARGSRTRFSSIALPVTFATDPSPKRSGTEPGSRREIRRSAAPFSRCQDVGLTVSLPPRPHRQGGLKRAQLFAESHELTAGEHPLLGLANWLG